MITLSQVETQTTVTISRILDSRIATRLADMGLYPGQAVSVLFKAPFGDPLAIAVGEYTLSLRKAEAALIEVQ